MWRMFGGWAKTLIAASVVSDANDAIVSSSGHLRRSAYYVEDSLIAESLREVAHRLGHLPNTTEYVREREIILQEEGRALPSYPTIQRHFGTWDNAFAFVGLGPPPIRRRTLPRLTPAPRTPTWTAALARPVIQEAYASIGDPFTVVAYRSWREIEIERDRAKRRNLPSLSTLCKVFGSWSDAREAARHREDGFAG
jgi:hypothetical protein